MASVALQRPASLSIQGIRLDNLTMADALAAIRSALARHTPIRIAFVNADCVNLAAGHAAYREALATMQWVFIDGIGMRIAGWLLRQPVRANVNGTDLFPELCAELATGRRRMFFLGAKPGVAAAAASWAAAHYPGLVIAGTRDGYFEPAESAEVADLVRAAQADVLLVAMGAPRQELWIRQYATRCGAPVTLGVGGLFDYYSGKIPRAPRWMRRAGLEWVHRLRQEPGRLWRRYLLGNWTFLARIVAEVLHQTWKRGAT